MDSIQLYRWTVIRNLMKIYDIPFKTLIRYGTASFLTPQRHNLTNTINLIPDLFDLHNNFTDISDIYEDDAARVSAKTDGLHG